MVLLHNPEFALSDLRRRGIATAVAVGAFTSAVSASSLRGGDADPCSPDGPASGGGGSFQGGTAAGELSKC